MQQTLLNIRPTGEIRFVWDDELAALADAGEARIVRASTVEPAPKSRGWIADLALSGGGIIGPFPLRCDALEAERVWIELHILSGAPSS